MVKVGQDVLDPTKPLFITADEIVTNPDGSVSFKTGNTYFGQEPNQYGKPNNNTYPGAYQKFTLTAPNVVVIQTRPQDEVFAYSIAVGKSF